MYLREGTYPILNTLEFNEADSGTDTAGVKWQGYEGENVRFVGGVSLNPADFKPVTDKKTLKRLSKDAQGKVYYYDLSKKGIKPGDFLTGAQNDNFFTNMYDVTVGNVLVVNNNYEQRGRYPNAYAAEVSHETPNGSKYIIYETERGTRWDTADKAWLWTLFDQGYRADMYKISEIDTEERKIYPEKSFITSYRGGWLWYITNLLEEVDMPGEWYSDLSTKKLYYYPRDDFKNSEILFSTKTDSLVKMNKTKNIVFSNIELEATCGNGFTIIDGVGNKIEKCKFENIGHHGVEVTCSDIAGTGNNGISDCDFYNIGFAGVIFRGGDREGLTPQNDYVENSIFENCTMETHDQVSSVMTDGTVGVRISNCLIHNDDSPAIWMGGNDDYIEYNEIYNVVRTTSDYGALYGDARGAQRQGVTLYYNYLHDIIGRFEASPKQGAYNPNFTMGFYADAGRNMGARVNNNAFVNVTAPIFFAQNQNMTARGNIIIDNESEGIHTYMSTTTQANVREALQAKFEKWLEDGTFEESTGKSDANAAGAIDMILYRSYQMAPEFNDETKDNYYLKYPWLEKFLYNHPFEVRDVLIKDNAIFNTWTGIESPNAQSDYIKTVDNYVVNETVTTDTNSNYDRLDKGMKIAAENLPNFEVWNPRDAGVKRTGMKVGNFSTTYPVNGSTDIDPDDFMLVWDYARGADEYRVLVATDAEFKNIVFDKKTCHRGIKVDNLEFGTKKYYWKVIASPFSEKFTGNPENINGTQSFYTLKYKEADKTILGDELAKAEAVLSNLVEGTEGGQFAAGSKAEFEKAVAAARTTYSQTMVLPRVVNSVADDLHAATQKVLSKINLKQVNGADIMLDKTKIAYTPQHFGDLPRDVDLAPDNVVIDGNSTTLIGSGGIYTKNNNIVSNNEIVHFKLKANFSGQTSGSYYTSIALRAQDPNNYIYNTPCYAFFVSTSAVELQGFKPPTKLGAFYYSKPNTFFELDKEHDVQFCVIPIEDGTKVRIILMVDGEIIYDIVDGTNIVENNGLYAVWSSNPACTVTISQPDEDTGYPSLYELLNDPNSELNKK